MAFDVILSDSSLASIINCKPSDIQLDRHLRAVKVMLPLLAKGHNPQTSLVMRDGLWDFGQLWAGARCNRFPLQVCPPDTLQDSALREAYGVTSQMI